MSAFKYFQEEWTPVINQYLEEYLASEVDDQKISQIMAYSVMAGGKRLRPLLFLATLNALGKEITTTEVRIACGIELIHTYSLIHDDLPAMDNDDYRRGKLTSHKKWGEAEAILAGDALLPMGIQWIAEGSNSAKLVAIITQAVGPNGMVGGQYLDIDSTNNASVAGDAKFINRMEWLKTGCLIQASVEMAAVYAKASQVEQVKLVGFAKVFGRSYQIYDDLVDVVETSEEAGKATHKDQEEGKNNTLTLLGIDRSRQELRDLIKQAQDDLHGLNGEVLAGFLALYQKVL
ncbi:MULTISPECIES: polyprenyl synthetase family protein [Lactobacillus]|uniref:Farnesyl diphosphate synthase n=1 Tax=Lactobacillus xujianguonis TaxID=2495899 RepID=A0A437SXK8_9LACO|nr:MULTISPECIES: polyprenyl synthetase family protein [Lactobacillus]RVU71655.1 polyprenyl synthetase family protein [Lactobacillus xujianguonis]RVU77694.1 polyprenyl synthetase family protein [Lactobacillus xujianguonis]